MSWIDKLDKHGHNVLIDELVYHLDQSKSVVSVTKSTEPSGYNFVFGDGLESFLSVFPHLLDDHWAEALEIAHLSLIHI